MRGRMRRVTRAIHNKVLVPLGRPSVYRPVILALVLLNIVALIRSFFGPHPPPPPRGPHGPHHKHDRVCTTPGCVQVSYELLHSVNQTVDPCDDFYEFATGGWRENHPIPSDQGLFGIGQYVLAENNKILGGILLGNTETTNKDDEASLHKLRGFYDACMDTKHQDKVGATPLLDDVFYLFRELRPSSTESLTSALAWMHQQGINAFFEPTVEGDPGHAPLAATPNLIPGGLGLPDSTYYDDLDVLKDYQSMISQAVVEVIRAAKKEKRHAEIMDFDAANMIAEAVVTFERTLAKMTPDVVQLSDPLAIYNPLSLSDLQELSPELDWEAYLKSMSTSKHAPRKVIVASKDYFEKLSLLLKQTPSKNVHAYLYWTLVRSRGLFLGPEVPLGEPARRLNRFTNGIPEDGKEIRETTCQDAVSKALGYMSGRFFAQKAFGPESKKQVESMMDSIRMAFYYRLEQLPWLDAKTRATARQKAEDIIIKVGYPVTPNTESASAIREYYSPLNVGKSYFKNQIAAKKFAIHQSWSRIGGSLNTGLIGDLVPSEVNAEYNAPQNEIVFPAGLLQPPYFDPKWPMYLQYGAFGTTAGHELSHAFDPSGRLFDKDGYLFNWWTPKTAKAFEKRQQCVEDQYAQKTMPGPDGKEHYLQSKFTIGEDVADFGGLAQSYHAWKTTLMNGDREVHKRNELLPGLTQYSQEQLFFIAYGAAWARNIRPAETVKRLKTDPHSPTKYRVNLPLSNFPPFAKAFGCKPGKDAMALATTDRCEIW
ncbi:endothelin-converting enzyme 1 [Malassezia psittaci]|uniref:Endothelin-converting enzyme 1 n=1 Tax=Malassezia psittaci TaxID=1821823 RepID=A0AAF0FB04_9BASI|nr:endothelin-converting enzyme 1 [Malassezia psittaci]